MLLTAKTIACVCSKKFMVPAESVQVQPLPTNTTFELTKFWVKMLLHRYLKHKQYLVWHYLWLFESIMDCSLRKWQWSFYWLPQLFQNMEFLNAVITYNYETLDHFLIYCTVHITSYCSGYLLPHVCELGVWLRRVISTGPLGHQPSHRDPLYKWFLSLKNGSDAFLLRELQKSHLFHFIHFFKAQQERLVRVSKNVAIKVGGNEAWNSQASI